MPDEYTMLEMATYQDDCTVTDAARIIANRILSGENDAALGEFVKQVESVSQGQTLTPAEA